jgi:hypothetical protein
MKKMHGVEKLRGVENGGERKGWLRSINLFFLCQQLLPA